MARLSLNHAETIIATAQKTARGMRLAPMAFAVLDAGGHLVALKREDNCFNVAPDIALGKAFTAVSMRRTSRDVMENLKNPSLLSALNAAHNGRFFVGIGAVLIVDENNELLGAAGATGDASDKDEACVIAGVEAAGFRTNFKA